ncbi:MAG TPA: HoxN/HupN/NixA family nickel/cobalt transporter [Magnetospirillaceae bacterium]|nr:HoxN/HupN/NixA family nickel/cobalt transporter [Magnetospirillaceae bacterium]
MKETSLRGRIILTILLLIGANIAAWLWAAMAFRGTPLLMGTALLAYGLGLRHAVDADHIAAIDNVTRKLMQEGRRPVLVGLFFSLGHSTVVIALSAGLAVTATLLQDRFALLKAIGGPIGTAVSALFLFTIAAANLLILTGLWRAFRSLRNGQAPAEEDLSILLDSRGLMGRLFRRLFRLIGRSWHMYPLGLLFGLGFDTATEVGLLGISAASGSQGLPLWSILVFPALFTAAMSLADTADGILMLGAYGWAFVKPVRKLYYNLTITLVSVATALLVGGVEALGLVADQLALEGRFWQAIRHVNADLGLLGYAVVGLFAAGWLLSLVIYRLKGFDKPEMPLSF